jgi:hypothetical protein
VIANTDFILLFMLLPAVLFAFVGVFVVLFLVGVKLSSLRAFYEISFFSLVVLIFRSNIYAFDLFVVKVKLVGRFYF